MRHHRFQSSPFFILHRLCRQCVLLPFLMVVLLLILKCNATKGIINFETNQSSLSSTETHLRGGYLNSMRDDRWTYNTPTIKRSINSQKIHQNLMEEEEINHRSVEASIPSIFLNTSSTFQRIVSILLSILIIIQVLVFMSFIHNRSKRVLEFAQPTVICIFVVCSIIATASCYLYVFVYSSFTCAIREPILFMSVSLMGATVAGRAWRISTLVNNPLLTAGKNCGANGDSGTEMMRKLMLRMLNVLSGSDCSISPFKKQSNASSSSGRPIRMEVTVIQLLQATFFIILPQLLWQVVVLSTPSLRSSRELASSTYLINEVQMMTAEQYQCQSSVGPRLHYVSAFLALCPYAIAYILNLRPKSESNMLPEMINERAQLEQSFYVFARVITVAAPVIGLAQTNNPEARVYSTICAVLALPLACCYYIAYTKLNAVITNTSKQQPHGSSTSHFRRMSRGKGAIGQQSKTSVLRMAKMFYMIGRNEEAVQLVDETLGLYQSNAGNLENVAANQEVALGFTKSDLKALEEEELELIIRLLKLKMNALERLEGMPGYSKRVKMNIGVLKLFENCPAGRTLKDSSFMFPIYNLAGEQIKTGVIDGEGGDEFSLEIEMELATHCYREAQLQSYHFARSLANLAELYGRLGMPDEAFKYFNIMEAVYMKHDHHKVLTEVYARDRCAISFASSALWYLQKGAIDDAIERCDYVIDHILPYYDKNEILGLYTVFLPLLRVLKWNGEAGKVLEAYRKSMPDAAHTHWAVGSLQKPILLLLQICDDSSHRYTEDVMTQHIETVLSFDVMYQQDIYAIHYGWSMTSLAAELCMLLASRLDAGSANREKLIDRGINMAKTAQQRMTTSNGKVKNMLALEANKNVYEKLLGLTNRDADVLDVLEDLPDSKDENKSITHNLASANVDLKTSVSGMNTPRYHYLLQTN